MSKLRYAPLVSTSWLKEQIFASVLNSSDTRSCHRVLDTSWLPEPDVDGYRQFYEQAHIPSSLHFDLKKVSPPSKASTAKFPIPDSNFFKEYVEHLGINNCTHVIAYDRINTRSSLRTWFLFRLFGHFKVSVLDGGLKKWISDGYHVTTEEPEVDKQDFSVKFQKNLFRDFESVMKNVDVQTEQLIDSRLPQSFYAAEGDDSGGHIPGAKNIPYTSLFNQDGTFKSKEDLQHLFNEAGVDLSKPIVSSCQSGITACGLIAAAFILGKEDVPLYNGSFTEWSKLADQSKIVRKKLS